MIFTLVTQLSHFSPFKKEHKEEKLQPGDYFTDNPYLPFQGEGEGTSLAMKGKITEKTKRKGEKRKKRREKKKVLYVYLKSNPGPPTRQGISLPLRQVGTYCETEIPPAHPI